MTSHAAQGSRKRAKRENESFLWQLYELEVAELLSTLEPGATIQHDEKVDGLVSQTKRQLDALVTGTFAGQPLRIAIEAKRHARPVEIGTIDAFVGKLLDIGVEWGILYSYGGFQLGARSRAANAHNPRVGLVHLHSEPETPEVPEAPEGPETHHLLARSEAVLVVEIDPLTGQGAPNTAQFNAYEYDGFLSGHGYLYRELYWDEGDLSDGWLDPDSGPPLA
ncbi:restriction endonuclease [Streptomyces alboflavus]|uniref:restriction endonuclease n=1 Tax=Streptomyces alboflavus TaxID=67267 RepID=UPI003678B7D3